MEALDQHPGLLAIDTQAKFVAARTKARTLRDKAASMRREAKAAALGVDAAKLRREAKPISEEAKGLEQDAAAYRVQVTKATLEATSLLTKRMPPEFAARGIMKTRAYAKVLGVLVSQEKNIHPNLPLATQAIQLLLTHNSWDDDILPKLAVISGVPKELPAN